MGCAQSRLDNEESVVRCKERRNLMKNAVVARNAFAAGHSGYAMALKNTGAALSDYGHGEVQEAHHQHQLHPPADASTQPQPPPPPPPQFDNLPPPPPPPPNFSPSPVKRTTSMPEIMLNQPRRPFDNVSYPIAEEGEEDQDEELEQEPKRKANDAENTTNNININLAGPRVPLSGGDWGSQAASRIQETPPIPEAKSMPWDYFFRDDNMPGSSSLEPELDEVRNENTAENDAESMGFSELEPTTPEKPAAEVVEEEEGKLIELSKTAPADFRRVVMKGELPSVNLMQVLSEIDDQFLKASECAQEVSKMLEATRLHYHSNFADNRGSFFTNLALACFWAGRCIHIYG